VFQITDKFKKTLDSVETTFIRFENPDVIVKGWEEAVKLKWNNRKNQNTASRIIDIPRIVLDTVETTFVMFQNKNTTIEVANVGRDAYQKPQKQDAKNVEDAFSHLPDSEIELRDYTSLPSMVQPDPAAANTPTAFTRVGLVDISDKERRERYRSPKTIYRRNVRKEYQASRFVG